MATSHPTQHAGLLTLVALSATLGCGHSAAGAPLQPRTSAPAAAVEIPRVEIDRAVNHATTAYDLIRLLRPTMLVSRDALSFPTRSQSVFTGTRDVRVYVDDLYVGGVEVLSSIGARSVVSIRRTSAATVASGQQRAGLSADAILITTEVPPLR